MRVLLDTHTLLWALFEPGKLGPQALAVLESEDAEVFTSSVNFFEIAQKVRIGKLPLQEGLVRELPATCREQGWQNLVLDPGHAISAGLYASVHRDPFDRLLTFQAANEGLILISKDQGLKNFPVETVW